MCHEISGKASFKTSFEISKSTVNINISYHWHQVQSVLSAQTYRTMKHSEKLTVSLKQLLVLLGSIEKITVPTHASKRTCIFERINFTWSWQSQFRLRPLGCAWRLQVVYERPQPCSQGKAHVAQLIFLLARSVHHTGCQKAQAHHHTAG